MRAISKTNARRLRGAARKASVPHMLRREPMLRIVHTVPAEQKSTLTSFRDQWGREIVLREDLLDHVVEEGQRLFEDRLPELFARPDEVWQDQDAVHGDHLRYLRFLSDHLLMAQVDMCDPARPFIFEWCALEYDVPARHRPLPYEIGDLRKGTLLSDERALDRSLEKEK